MVEVRRKRGESFEAMWRRFSRRFQLSGTSRQTRKIRYHEDEKNKNAIKRSALRKLELRRQSDKLEKLGQLPDILKKKRKR